MSNTTSILHLPGDESRTPINPLIPAEGLIRLYDNSRLTLFDSCHRKFFLQNEMGWSLSGTEIAPGFGNCWHSAMDVVWKLLCTEEGRDPRRYASTEHDHFFQLAFDAFMKEWHEQDLPDPANIAMMDTLMPRTPAVGREMLWNYIQINWDFIAQCELIGVEQPFLVSLTLNDPNLFYSGRMDKVVLNRNTGFIEVVDHKSTKAYAKHGFFRDYFSESFSPNSQVDGYAYAAYLCYGPAYNGDVRIDAALVHKTVHNGFKFFPIKRSAAQLDGWRWETLDRIQSVEANRDALEKQKEGERQGLNREYMNSFRKDNGACFDYMKPCIYLDTCKYVANPHREEPPPGFSINHWSPFKQIDLQKIGLEPDRTTEKFNE